MKPIAFVIPWYGDNIKGGAETECNQLAHCLKRAGIEVEVFTTCVKQAADDRGINTMKDGVFIESGILVRRFKVRKRNADRFHAANYKLYNNLPTELEDEKAYFEEDINSPDMYRYINEHKEDYEYFIFMPYLYGITYNGMKECPDNCLMIPCFHDESYAYMKLVRECVEKAKGLIFLSRPEYELANHLYNLSGIRTAILGAFVESGWEEKCDPQAFRNKFSISDPFILCAGRKEPGKKVDMLLDYFVKYKENRPDSSLKLVLIGGGEIDIPQDYNTEIIDLGFVTVEDKHNAMSAAYLLCNPSFFESFSIVIMESWLVKRPVLVAEQCTVTKNFCLETNGGLFFDSYAVFSACLDYLLCNEETANQMGMNGYEYVMNNFVEKQITQKYIDFLNANEHIIGLKKKEVFRL